MALAGLALVACDDDGDDPETDAGPGIEVDGSPGGDAGPGDGGPGGDAGPGGNGTSCGPMGGECTITPGSADSACAADPGTGAAQGCLLQGGGADPWTAMCFPVGVVPEGGDCDPMMAGQCMAGFQCFGDPGSATCARLCCSSNDCNPGDSCVLLSGAGPDGSEAGTCRSPVDCDPLSTMTDGSNGCPAGQGCFTVGGNLGCFAPGGLAEGEACGTLNGCMAGFGCYGTGGGMATTCRRVCNPMDAAPSTCDAGETCVALTGYTEVGFCNPM